tara:strand:+ start:129 stop:485 length:357 start_codon:yes stop_codon:yes gene_type:complete
MSINTSGQVSIRGEGSATTMNLQQGLCKAWVEGNDDATFSKSFNISSGSDDGTGDYSYNFTSSLGSADMVVHSTCGQNAVAFGVNNQRSTSLFGVKIHNDAATLVDRTNLCSVLGDLA